VSKCLPNQRVCGISFVLDCNAADQQRSITKIQVTKFRGRRKKCRQLVKSLVGHDSPRCKVRSIVTSKCQVSSACGQLRHVADNQHNFYKGKEADLGQLSQTGLPSGKECIAAVSPKTFMVLEPTVTKHVVNGPENMTRDSVP
jgi:hypothetical protein